MPDNPNNNIIRMNADTAFLEARVLWLRTRGATRRETGRDVDLEAAQVGYRERVALRRYGCTTLDEYKAIQATVLSALIEAFRRAIEDPATDRFARARAALNHASLHHMLSDTPAPPTEPNDEITHHPGHTKWAS